MFVLVVNGDLNGPTICGIFTIVGFSSTGKHSEKYCSYYVWGLSCKFYKNMGDQSAFTDPALLFSTTLAPVAGKFGPVVGIIAGYLHSSVALNVGIVYGGIEFV